MLKLINKYGVWIKIIQVVVAILLMAAILMQNRGAGWEVSLAIGGVYLTKRGLERNFIATIILAAILFFYLWQLFSLEFKAKALGN